MIIDIIGKTDDNQQVLLYTTNDKNTAKTASKILDNLAKREMLVTESAYIHNISVNINTKIPFDAYIYIDVNEIFKTINIEELAKDNIEQTDTLIDTISSYNEEIGIALEKYFTENTINDVMKFITIHKEKTYYSDTETNGETLGYIVPCVFDVTSFLKEINKEDLLLE